MCSVWVTDLAFFALFLKASNGGSKYLHIGHHNLVFLQKSLQQRGMREITVGEEREGKRGKEGKRVEGDGYMYF